MSDPRDRALAELAYDALLSLPIASIARMDAQAALSACRDLVAKLTGKDAETVQNEHEARAYARRLPEPRRPHE